MPTDLDEALTAVGAAPLIQKDIDPVLLEYERRYSPLVRTVPTTHWTSNIYYFNRRNTVPSGGFVQDGGAVPVSTSDYEQLFFPIKLLQSVGAVTGYAQQVTADLIGSLRATEIEGAARGQIWDIETGMDWGNADSSEFNGAPQFDGFDTLASTFTGDTQNAIDFHGSDFSLGVLDQLIDLVETNVAAPVEATPWMFVMSPTANSRLAQLLENQQRFLNQVEVAAGLIVPSYRNVPIIKSSFLAPRTQVMSAVTTSVGAGGTLAEGEFFYQVSAIMSRFGETQACTEVTATTSNTTSAVTLSFTPPTGPEGAYPLTYKVFRSTATGTETLLGYVCGQVASNPWGQPATVTNQIVDTGATLIAQNSVGPVQPSTYPPEYVDGNTSIYPLGTGDQNVYLISRDPNFLIRPYVRNLEAVDLYPTTASPDSLPFAFVSDTTLAIRGLKYLARASAVNAVLAS